MTTPYDPAIEASSAPELASHKRNLLRLAEGYKKCLDAFGCTPEQVKALVKAVEWVEAALREIADQLGADSCQELDWANDLRAALLPFKEARP